MNYSTECVQQNDSILADSATSRPKKRPGARPKRAKRQFRNLVDKTTGKPTPLKGKYLEEAQRRGDVIPDCVWLDHLYVDSKTGERTQLTDAQFDEAKKNKKIITFGAYRIRQYKKRKASGNVDASSRVVVQASIATDPAINCAEKELPILTVEEVENELNPESRATQDNAEFVANLLNACNENMRSNCFLLENNSLIQNMLAERPFLIVEGDPVDAMDWLIVKLPTVDQFAAPAATTVYNPNAFFTFHNSEPTGAQENRTHSKSLGSA